jgi:hypothetical protein
VSTEDCKLCIFYLGVKMKKKILKSFIYSSSLLGLCLTPILSYADTITAAGDTGYCGGNTHQVCTQHIYNKSSEPVTVNFYQQGSGDTGHESYTLDPHTYVPLMYCANAAGESYITVNVLVNGVTHGSQVSSGENHCPHMYDNGTPKVVEFNRHPISLDYNPYPNYDTGGSDGDIIIWDPPSSNQSSSAK